MRRISSVTMVRILTVLAVVLAGGTALAGGAADGLGWTHPGAEAIRSDRYQGPQTCAVCHEYALREITHSVHWYAAGKVKGANGLPDGSWWGMVNRECALAGTTALANWTASTDGKFTPEAAGCGMCHIAALTGPPLPAGREATAEEAATVDCLVCHAATYDMSVRKTLTVDEQGRKRWGQDRSLAAALSITRVPTAEACLRCHEHAFSLDYKRGTPFTPTNDVHAAAGMPCTTCHLTRNHRIAKGQTESDMLANDLPGVSVTCDGCHGPHPHRGAVADALDAHTARIACQSCHITVASGVVSEDWGKPVADDRDGRWSTLSRYDGIPSIAGLHVPTVDIRRSHPDVMWRTPNAGDVPDAQSWMAFATATRSTDGAKLYPVRGLTQTMLFDRKLKMQQAPGMDFLAKDPETAAFPLLLAPNREVYNRTGDIDRALAAGMKPYEAFGLHWSGEWMAMKVPGTSFISVNHGVKRMGYTCADCHSPHGVLDFAALGYPPDEVAKLEQPRGLAQKPARTVRKN
jgi:hypothetical protein